MKLKYEYLLFDADNTLLDFNAAEKNALQSTLNGMGLKFTDDIHESYHKINDDLWKSLERGEIGRDFVKLERFRRLFAKYKYECDCFEDLADIFMNNIASQGIALNGAINTLETLRGKYKLYIVTNGTAKVQVSRLSISRIDKYLDGIYMSQAIGYDKPKVEFFDYVVSDIGDEDLSKYLVIGDSLTSDIKGAENKGIDSCYLNYNNTAYDGYNPKYVINNIEELICLLV